MVSMVISWAGSLPSVVGDTLTEHTFVKLKIKIGGCEL